MINGVLLDSIGLALFSLAWWGWLIGGGLAVVGMLFGVHVAVGAPEAQAAPSMEVCDFYQETIDYLVVEGQRQINEGNEEEGLLLLSRIPGWEADLEKCLQDAKVKSEKSEPTWHEKAPNFPAQSPEVYPMPQPSEPASPVGGLDLVSEVAAPEPVSHDGTASKEETSIAAAESRTLENINRLSAALVQFQAEGRDTYGIEEQIRRLQAPIAYGHGSFDERLRLAIDSAPEGSHYNDDQISSLAADVALGEVQRTGSLQEAITETRQRIAIHAERIDDSPVFAQAPGEIAQLTLNERMMQQFRLHSAYSGIEVAYLADTVTLNVSKATKTDGGKVDIHLETNASAGSQVKVVVKEYNAKKDRMVVADTTKVKVGKSGQVQTTVEAGVGDVIEVSKSSSKKWAQIELLG
mgnify:CR=1 FL=1